MEQRFNAPVTWSRSAGPTLTSAAAATCLPSEAKVDLPSQFFNDLGRSILIRASGRISCVVTTPGTARFDVRLGGTVVWDSLAIPLNVVAKTNVGWVMTINLWASAVGSSAALTGQGMFTSEATIGAPAAATAAPGSFNLPYNTNPGTAGNTFNSSVAQTLDMFFTQTVGTGSMTLLNYVVTG